MNSKKQILGKCFKSRSSIWSTYLEKEDDINILYYPSAWKDLRPLLFSKKESLEYIGIKNLDGYHEPNLFIFSDYFPHKRSDFFNHLNLHIDLNTSITIQEYCELYPDENNFDYLINSDYVDPVKSDATGKAIFFRVKITSHILKEPYYRDCIYFFYENVNLLEQLFLKHHLDVDQLVWKRDGSGIGGGKIYHDFLYPVSILLNTRYYYIWDFYLNDDNAVINADSLRIRTYPLELAPYLSFDFSLSLSKLGTLQWEIEDNMNFYKKVHSEMKRS